MGRPLQSDDSVKSSQLRDPQAGPSFWSVSKHMTVRNLCYEHDKVIMYCKAKREITTGKDFLSFCWFLFPVLLLS